MSKQIRFIILLICAVLFFIITPYILLYSLGYRVDFENRKIVTTGGIYVRVLPQGADVIIDSKISNKTGLFSNSVFVQDLLPKQHMVLIKKDGYHEYQKNLEVKENEVTKLENVILFKKNNNLYYSDILENSNLTQTQKNTAVIKNIVTYKINGNNIIWLGLDGFLYKSDSNGKNPEKVSQAALKIKTLSIYKVFVFNQNIFLKENNNLLLFDQDEKIFKNFYSNAVDIKISGNGQKLLYYNDHEILFSDVNNLNGEKMLLNRFSEQIKDCYWVNDDYIIFQLGSKIIISEIDVRGNINTVQMPQTITLNSGATINIENPKISFDQQDKKLYILTQPIASAPDKNTVLVSERLVP